MHKDAHMVQVVNYVKSPPYHIHWPLPGYIIHGFYRWKIPKDGGLCLNCSYAQWL